MTSQALRQQHGPGAASATAAGGTPVQLPALTSVRAFAAMGIVLLHFRLATGIEVLPATWRLTQSLSLFFVLSGFILAYRYPELASKRAHARYLIARVARIWPLHLFTLFVVALLTPFPYQIGVGLPVFLLNAFLLHAWVPVYSVYGSFNAPSFSLSIELFAYLCFPFLIRGKSARAWVAKIAIPLALAVAMIVVADVLLPETSSVDRAGLVYNHPLARLWEFAIGIGAAALWMRLKNPNRLGFGTATALEIAVVALIVANVAKTNQLIESLGLGAGAGLWLANAGLAALPFAALLVLLAEGRGLVSRALSLRPLVVLGDISYSTYLLHGLLILPLTMRWDIFRDLTDRQLAASFVLAVLVASYLSWALVEVPGRALILGLSRRLIDRRRPADARPPRPQGQWRARVTWPGLAACAAASLATAGMVSYAASHRSWTEDLPRLSGTAAGVLERAGTSSSRAGETLVLDRGDVVTVSGWVIDPAGRSNVRGVLVSIDDRKVSWLPAGFERKDIVRRTGDARYRFSGFTGPVRIDGLGPGTHVLRARAVLFRPAGYIPLTTIRVRVS